MKKGMTTAVVRTRLDAATWALLLEGYESSDLSIKDYCLSRGISAASFYQWRKRLDENKETAKTLFSPIELVSKPTGGVIVELSGGISLRFGVLPPVEYEAGRVWVRRIVRPKYARREDNEEAAGGQIVQAPAKEMPLGRSKAGVSLVAHILMSKYVEHLPLHRLIARFARGGLKIPPATIGQWVKTGADRLLILYEAYKKIVFESFYLQMDETTLKVLEDGKGKAHLGYLWAVFDPVNKLPFFFIKQGATTGVRKNYWNVLPAYCNAMASACMKR